VLSKTLAERAAWEIAKAEKLDLVTVNPSFVVGPMLSRRLDATSILQVKASVPTTRGYVHGSWALL
jgi:nucleoside-diphosphate-sugar epimerase